MKKKCTVVMLSTNKKAHFGDIILNPKTNKPLLFKHQNSTEVKQNLYVLSDDKIEVDDITYHKRLKSISLCDTPLYNAYYKSGELLKVIASTNDIYDLPKIPNNFIQEYCKKGGIDEVMVEYYEPDGLHGVVTTDKGKEILQPKINPDNTISIYPVKDSWNREEIKELVLKAAIEGYIGDIEKWIEENL